MQDKFKTFLAGAPNWMDESHQQMWADFVVNELPDIIRAWYDLAFADGDLWSKSADYYQEARMKLVVKTTFNQNFSESGKILQVLKLLADFIFEEKRKAGLGKTTRKAPKVTAPKVTPPVIEVLEEGEIKEMHISKHERNSALRRSCIEYYRTAHEGRVICEGCGMEFGKVYGPVGDGYIEVHHLSPISQTEGSHAVDPKSDLVPLCANCHAMIHRLMAAEKKNAGTALEGDAALGKLRAVIEENR